jgi:hypothetical protein
VKIRETWHGSTPPAMLQDSWRPRARIVVLVEERGEG